MIALCIDGISNSMVQLEPDIIYRVGRRSGLEFYIDKESIEPAHATIALICGGIVRIAAVTGNVSVNGHETGLEVKSICDADAINGIVDLRFGNVPAKLRFDACNNSANVTCEFVEGIKDKSLNISADSLSILESEAQTTNNTVNMDSFVIPETQAISLNRSANVSKLPDIPLDEDDLIPETQDVRRSISDNAFTRDQNHDNEDVDSELGSQIRICTQDFNADAIDDFDSSLLDRDVGLSVLHPFQEKDDKARPDLDMSALNWSASNSQRTALNITKANDTSEDACACITPELSIAGQPSEGTNTDGSITPDIFDIIMSDDRKHTTVAALSSANKNAEAQNQCVARMETPDNTPTDPLEGVMRLSVTAQIHDYKEDSTKTEVILQKSSSEMPLSKSQPCRNQIYLEDIISTDVISAQKSLPLPNEKVDTSLNSETEIPDRDDDMVETQLFIPPQENINKADADAYAEDCLQVPDTISLGDELDEELSQLIALSGLDEEQHVDQVNLEGSNEEPPSKSKSPQIAEEQSEEKLSRNSIYSMLEPSESSTSKQTRKRQISKSTDSAKPAAEFKEDVPGTKETRTRSKRSAATNQSLPAKKARGKTHQLTAEANLDTEDCLQVPDTISLGDELDEELNQLIALSAVDEEQHIDQVNFEESNREPPSKSKSPQIAEEQSEEKLSRNSIYSMLEPSESSTSKQTRKRQISKSTDSAEPAAESKDVAGTKETRRRSKRSAATNQSLPAKKARGKTHQLTGEANLDTEDCLQVPDTISLGDELDEELNQLIALSALDEEQHIDQVNFEESNREPPPSKSKSPQIAEEQSEEKLSRNSIYSMLEPSESSTSKQTRKRQISKSTDSAEPAAESKEDVAGTKETRRRSKRSAATNQSLRRGKTLQPTAGEKLESLTSAANDPEDPTKHGTRKSRKGATQESQKFINDGNESVSSSQTMPGRKTRKPSSAPKFFKTGDDQDSVATVARRTKRQTRSKNTIEENNNENIKTSIHNEENKEITETKQSMESTEQANEMPTTSANARRMSTRRNKGSDPLKDINDYIRKIRSSGCNIRLAFSMCNSKELISMIDLLKNDIDVINDPLECDLLIMDKGERTYKFLVAVASNKPILCSQWLYEMKETRSITVKPSHVFKDEAFETIFKFRPLAIFEKPGLLKGHHFLLGTNIHPNASEMKAIIESAGGKVYSKRPSVASKFKLFAVVSKQDTPIWQILRNFNNVSYIKTEVVMQALVRHDVDLLHEHTLNVRS